MKEKNVPHKTKVEELNFQISKNERSLKKIHNNERIMNSRTMEGEKLSWSTHPFTESKKPLLGKYEQEERNTIKLKWYRYLESGFINFYWS